MNKIDIELKDFIDVVDGEPIISELCYHCTIAGVYDTFMIGERRFTRLEILKSIIKNQIALGFKLFSKKQSTEWLIDKGFITLIQ